MASSEIEKAIVDHKTKVILHLANELASFSKNVCVMVAITRPIEVQPGLSGFEGTSMISGNQEALAASIVSMINDLPFEDGMAIIESAATILTHIKLRESTANG